MAFHQWGIIICQNPGNYLPCLVSKHLQTLVFPPAALFDLEKFHYPNKKNVLQQLTSNIIKKHWSSIYIWQQPMEKGNGSEEASHVACRCAKQMHGGERSTLLCIGWFKPSCYAPALHFLAAYFLIPETSPNWNFWHIEVPWEHQQTNIILSFW